MGAAHFDIYNLHYCRIKKFWGKPTPLLVLHPNASNLLWSKKRNTRFTSNSIKFILSIHKRNVRIKKEGNRSKSEFAQNIWVVGSNGIHRTNQRTNDNPWIKSDEMKSTNDVYFAKICLININKIIDSEHYIQNSLLGEWLNEWHCISLGVTRYCFMYCLICRQIVSAYHLRSKKKTILLCGTLTIITLTTYTLRSSSSAY